MFEDVHQLRARLGKRGDIASDGMLRCLLCGQKMPGHGLLNLAALFSGTKVEQSQGWSCNLDRARNTFLRWDDWRQQLNGDIEKVAAMTATGFVLWHGHDKSRLPTCWVRPALHNGGENDLESVALCYHILTQEGCKRADAGGDDGACRPFAMVYDRRDLSFWQARRNAAECRSLLAANVGLAEVFMDMYYARAGKAYVLGGGWFWRACWNFAKPFVSSETARRLHVLHSQADLLHHFELNEIPEPWYSELLTKV